MKILALNTLNRNILMHVLRVCGAEPWPIWQSVLWPGGDGVEGGVTLVSWFTRSFQMVLVVQGAGVVRYSMPALKVLWDSAEVTGICGRQAGCNTSELYNR